MVTEWQDFLDPTWGETDRLDYMSRKAAFDASQKALQPKAVVNLSPTAGRTDAIAKTTPTSPGVIKFGVPRPSTTGPVPSSWNRPIVEAQVAVAQPTRFNPILSGVPDEVMAQEGLNVAKLAGLVLTKGTALGPQLGPTIAKSQFARDLSLAVGAPSGLIKPTVDYFMKDAGTLTDGEKLKARLTVGGIVALLLLRKPFAAVAKTAAKSLATALPLLGAAQLLNKDVTVNVAAPKGETGNATGPSTNTGIPPPVKGTPSDNERVPGFDGVGEVLTPSPTPPPGDQDTYPGESDISGPGPLSDMPPSDTSTVGGSPAFAQTPGQMIADLRAAVRQTGPGGAGAGLRAINECLALPATTEEEIEAVIACLAAKVGQKRAVR